VSPLLKSINRGEGILGREDRGRIWGNSAEIFNEWVFT